VLQSCPMSNAVRTVQCAVVLGLHFLTAELHAQVLVRTGGVTGFVLSVVPVGGEIWLGAENGAFRVDRKINQAVRRGGPDPGDVASIVPVGDEIWIGADYGVFRVDRKINQAVRFGANIGSVASIVPVGDEIWIGCYNGIFRVDRRTRISVDLAGALPGVTRLLGMTVWLEGIRRKHPSSMKTQPTCGPYSTSLVHSPTCQSRGRTSPRTSYSSANSRALPRNVPS
jgi:hypothetical protein